MWGCGVWGCGGEGVGRIKLTILPSKCLALFRERQTPGLAPLQGSTYITLALGSQLSAVTRAPSSIKGSLRGSGLQGLLTAPFMSTLGPQGLELCPPATQAGARGQESPAPIQEPERQLSPPGLNFMAV